MKAIDRDYRFQDKFKEKTSILDNWRKQENVKTKWVERDDGFQKGALIVQCTMCSWYVTYRMCLCVTLWLWN